MILQTKDSITYSAVTSLPKSKSKCNHCLSFNYNISNNPNNLKSGKLEGERTKPNYKQILENPILNYSGVFQHFDLYVTTQIFANNQALCMPVKTSYKYIEKLPWQWDEWLTLPLRISDLPRNSQLVITAFDIESPQGGDTPVCGATLSLFDKYGEFRQGVLELRMWPNKVGDGNTRTTTPGLLSDFKEDELDETNGSPGLLNEESTIMNTQDEYPMLDELDRLAKVGLRGLSMDFIGL